MAIILKREQAIKLLEMFSEDIPDEEITVSYSPKYGLVAWNTEYPEEGSVEL